MARTRIAVVGVGAIGGAIAADLADLDRHEMLLCARAAIDRLEVQHPNGTSSIAGPIETTPPTDTAPVDWVLLAVKAHQSAAAKPWLDALCGPATCVAVLQNGVEHIERVAPLIDDQTSIVPVVVQLPADRTAPGRVVVSHNGLLRVPDDPAGRAFAALFAGARTRVAPTDDFLTQAWWKLVFNASLGGVCALVERENGIASDPGLQGLLFELMREAAAVGRAEGAELPDDAAEKALAAMALGAPDHWSSITVDRREGRPMEWEARNAVVGRLGRQHGIDTPMNDAVTTLLRLADAAGS